MCEDLKEIDRLEKLIKARRLERTIARLRAEQIAQEELKKAELLTQITG